MTAYTTRYNKAKRALFDRMYSFLNERQREAVFTVDNPLLVLAGAGSGKTTVLVHRIAFILRYGNAYYQNINDDITQEEVEKLESAMDLPLDELPAFLDGLAVGKCPPWAVLSITFTNKAAKEMKERLIKVVGEERGAQDIWAGTFHSVCVRILRRHGIELNIPSNFTIYDAEDSKRLISSIMKDLNIDEKILPVKMISSLISKYKEQLVTPEEAVTPEKDFKMSRILRVYKEYERRLSEANALDFDDIIMKTVQLLKTSESVRDYYQSRFKYVCVDEYQDTNHAQFELAKLLSGKYRNLMVVGDDDQSIYKFRGATIKNILEFDTVFSDAKTVKLEQNYRSTENILNAANAVIKNNVGRKGKNLWTKNGKGDAIVLKKLDDQNAEASYIANSILELAKNENRKFNEFAVLYRMNAQSNAIEKVLARAGVPYRVLGGTRFYDRKEIKDIMAYLCVINNTNDNLRLQRIINEPKRKIGSATLEAIADISANDGISYFEVISNASKYVALAKAAPVLTAFANLIKQFVIISKSETLSSLFAKVIDMSGYRDMLVAAGPAEADRVENIDELISNAVEFENQNDDATLQSFLEEVSLISDIDNYDADADSVVLMTIHSAKGLEFPIVYLPGMENGIFPGVISMSDNEDMEEERRLAYVAITRAKQKLILSHVKERLMFGKTQYNQISRFITEIPSDLLDVQEEIRHRNYMFESKLTAKARREEAISKGIGAPNVFVGKGSAKEKNGDVFVAGDTVIHPSFGRGDVLSARSMGRDYLYEIAFDNFGTKKLMGSYAKLKKAE